MKARVPVLFRLYALSLLLRGDAVPVCFTRETRNDGEWEEEGRCREL